MCCYATVNSKNDISTFYFQIRPELRSNAVENWIQHRCFATLKRHCRPFFSKTLTSRVCHSWLLFFFFSSFFSSLLAFAARQCENKTNNTNFCIVHVYFRAAPPDVTLLLFHACASLQGRSRRSLPKTAIN